MLASHAEFDSLVSEILMPSDLSQGASSVLVRLTKQDLTILANAINEAQEAIDEWELSTRMGAEPAEIEELRRRLSDLLRMDEP